MSDVQHSSARSVRRLVLVRNACLAVFVLSLVLALLPRTSEAAPEPGGAGTDTSLPLTDSARVVKGRGPFSSLEITVNQTANLTNQAISLTWTGGEPTIDVPREFSGNYLQVMQCWGDDDGTNPANPGPPPEQCVQGAGASSVDGGIGDLFPPAGEELGRTISRTTWDNYDEKVGALDATTGRVWREFRSVDGTVVGTHLNPTFNPAVEGGSYWLNPFFDITTSNEIAGAATNALGEGSASFEVTTGVESSGLGCGQSLVPPGGGEARILKCWLVVVPRGTPEAENLGTPFVANAAQRGVMTSPLSEEAWQNRIAVPLEFRPVDSSCQFSATERRIAGTELLLPAIANWQPALCSTPEAPPYTYGTVSDGQARQQLVAPTSGSPGMAVANRPIDPALVDPRSPVVYAPLSVSGLVIGFNVDRRPKSSAPQEEQDLFGTAVEEINLTPRLLAKLLTQSYRDQVAILGSSPPYDWVADNPSDLGRDPDFLRFNPEFELLESNSRKNFGGLLTLARSSDAARQVWAFVLADPEAKAWLDGTPDEWGMKVNPVYATSASANSNGVAFGEPIPESFPKADPYCYQASDVNGSVTPPTVCSTDWMPYVGSLSEGARLTRVGDDRAKVQLNPFALTPDQAWKRFPPQYNGTKTMLSLTDTASARRYGIQTAKLSQAGDDGPERAFIAADQAGMTAAVEDMSPGAVASVLEADPATRARGAYPLTALSYGMVRPLTLDATAREEYAAFIEYAVGPGQEPGLQLGQLPPGYAELSSSLKSQALEAAVAIRTLQPTPEEEEVAVAAPPSASVTPPDAPAPSPSAPAAQRRATSSTPTQPEETAAPAAPVETVASTAPDVGPLTPILALARNRFFIPILGAVAVLASLFALEITKRPRRGRVGATEGMGVR